ncbi:MAG: hypothetical protein ACKO04_09850 [Actinomycetes bacterium]
MTPAVLLERLVRRATASGHLPECPRPGRPVEDCDWCLFALRTPEVDRLAELGVDAVVLREAPTDQLETVAWVVAATEVRRQLESVDLDAVLVPAARNAAHQALQEVRADVDSLGRVLDRVVAPGSGLDHRCCVAAGALTAAALRSGHTGSLPSHMPDSLLQRATDASQALSEELQVTTLLPLLEHLQWRGLPQLLTQPEWARRPAPDEAVGVAETGLLAGSLEALVVESVVDRCTDEFLAIGKELSAVAGHAELRRPRRPARYSSQTRRKVFRRLRVDWSLTLVDTGRADFWAPRHEGDDVVVEVPWTVAASVALGARHGLASAVAA